MLKAAGILAALCILGCMVQGSLAQQRVCGSYTINDGDTFWKISQARGVSVQGIMNVNPGVVPEKLRIGQTINLPCAGGGSPPSGPAPPSRAPLVVQPNPLPAARPDPAPPAGVDQRAMDMYNEIMRYRASRGLPSIPLCKHLNTVAAAHVADLQATYRGGQPKEPCNLHSWSQSSRWSGCCYTSDHKAAKCMWDKPRELSGYKADGFEISHWYWNSNPSVKVTASSAVTGWKNSPGHHVLMINDGQWKQPWRAIGVALSDNHAATWFGREPCPP